jgi:hypothetical protein
MTEPNMQDTERDDRAARLGVAVADLVENVVDNALKLAEDVANDSARIARSARDFVRALQVE